MILRTALEKLDEAIDSLEKNAEAVSYASPMPLSSSDDRNNQWRRQTIARLDSMIAKIEKALDPEKAIPADRLL